MRRTSWIGILGLACSCQAAPTATPNYVTYGQPVANTATAPATTDGTISVCDAIALALADLDNGLVNLASDELADADAVDSNVEEYDIRIATFTVDGAYASVQLGGIRDMSLTYVDALELVDDLRAEVDGCDVLHDDAAGAWEREDDAPNLTFRRERDDGAGTDTVWARPFQANALVLVMRN